MIAVSMDARRRNEPGQAVEQLKGREAKHFAAVPVGLEEPVDQASLRRGERLDAAGGVESLEGERPPRTVPNKPLETRSVLALDANGAIDSGRRH